MLNVRLAGDHLYWKQLCTWLSMVMSLMASFCAVFFFQRDVLDEIWDQLSQFLRVFLPTLGLTLAYFTANSNLEKSRT